MQKEKTKTVTNPVGATSSRPNFEEFTKNRKGITLIALIITIIVMLILVGVTVSVSLNGGLFSTAKDAADRTELEKDKETALSNGEIEIGGVVYSSIEDYRNKKGKLPDNAEEIPEAEAKAEGAETANWDLSKVRAIEVEETDGSTETIPLPNGFSISLEEGEHTVSEGLVITDGDNEFVWIPVATDFILDTSEEPTELTDDQYDKNFEEVIASDIDSQDTLDYFYGEGHFIYPETAQEKANVNNTFAYAAHYAEMVASVNKYGGFYIGRYETTIDGNNIGSKAGTTVLTADQTLEQTGNQPCRWWGLYVLQRNSNVAGNGNIIQTNMIWGQQCHAMLTYFNNQDKDVSETPVNTLVTSGKQNAGQAQYSYDGKIISDEICNIFDLRANTLDWTAAALDACMRCYCGGDYSYIYYVNLHYGNPPSNYDERTGSRLTLYIK